MIDFLGWRSSGSTQSSLRCVLLTTHDMELCHSPARAASPTFLQSYQLGSSWQEGHCCCEGVTFIVSILLIIMQVREAVNVKFFNNSQRIFTTAELVESEDPLFW